MKIMKLRTWLKTIVVGIIAFMLIASYSLIFIDFSSFRRNDDQQEVDFEGPSEAPPEDFKLPEGPPSVEEPTEPPPSN